METSTLKLLTIIADEALLHVLENSLIEFGAKGYTVTRVEGKGKTGLRNNVWEGENIKLEAIVSADVLEKALAFIQANFFERYAVIVYYQDVNVIRTSHFI